MSKRKKYPDPEYLREILTYCGSTGVLRWNMSDIKTEKWNSRYSGSIALNSIEPTGYLRGTIDGSQYKSHLIAWAIYYGKYPEGEIDHINGDKSDNRIVNLREATRSQNQINIGLRKSNTSGYKGASWKKRNGKWQAQIQINGKTKYLGLHDTAEKAHEAYTLASLKYHGKFGRS